MKTIYFASTILVISLLLSCKSGNDESKTADSAKVDNALLAVDSSAMPVSSSAAVVGKKEDGRKFVRTAELKFKAKSVVKATYDIEDIVNRLGGFVTYTNLSSTIDNTSSTQVSEDSTLETTYYTVNNTMTIRVANNKLDTTLKEIAKNIDYLDFK